MHAKLSTKTHLPLPLPLPLTTLALPPLTISLTKIAFNSGDTSLNGIVMGLNPFQHLCHLKQLFLVLL